MVLSRRMLSSRLPCARLVLSALLMALPVAHVSWAEVDGELSEADLLEIARHAPPAPEPAFDDPGGRIDDEDARRVVSAPTRYGRGLPPPGAGADLWPVPPDAGVAAVIGTVPALGEPTTPQPVYDTMHAPWNMVAKLLMRFVVDGKPRYYSCSGVLISPFHLATAAHCVFSWDPNGDGRMDDAAWADDVWVWPAQTDLLPPLGMPERPYGESRSVLNRAYAGWTEARDITWDIALVTLNRRGANLTGWMGLDVDHPVAGVSFSGYPTEQPYVPPDTVLQYAGSAADNVVKYGTRQMYLNAYSYGGQSGGPVWREDDGYHLQGVMSVSDRHGAAAAALITAGTAEDFFDWMATDGDERSPVDRPDLCEYVLAPDAKALDADVVQQGGQVNVTFNVYNAGTAESGPIAVDFYLSHNTAVADSDFFVERRELDGLAPDGFVIATAALTIPRGAPVGSYYLGWMMQAAETEYSTSNNSALIGDPVLRVAVASTPTATPSPPPTETAPPPPTETATEVIEPTAPEIVCIGDCRGDLRVTIDEIVLMVAIGLGAEPLDVCPNGDGDHDGQVVISELIASVRHALDGCGQEP